MQLRHSISKASFWSLKGTKIGTLAVQCLASVTFAELRSSPVMTLPSAYFTCAELLTILLVSRRFEATHNPLVHGLSPRDPTLSKASDCAALSVMGNYFIEV